MYTTSGEWVSKMNSTKEDIRTIFNELCKREGLTPPEISTSLEDRRFLYLFGLVDALINTLVEMEIVDPVVLHKRLSSFLEEIEFSQDIVDRILKLPDNSM